PSKFYINYRDSDNINIGYQQYIELIADTWIIYSFTISSAYVSDVAGFYLGFDAGWSDYPVLVKFDYALIVHVDSFLPDTNDYATDVLLDAWDFEEGDTETLRWQTNTPASVTYVDGKLRCEVTAVVGADFYIQFDPVLYPDITDYDLFVMKLRSSVAGSIRMFSHVIGVGWKTHATVSMYDDEVFRVETDDLEYQSYAQTQGIRFRFVKTGGNYAIGDYIEIEYIKLIDLEAMPYSTIQNSVLIESETTI
ncbi:unnamed protein product, partial [marine sediment metagenome]